MIIANVGDSRAVMAVTSDDGKLEPVQLTRDHKPNVPGKLLLHTSSFYELVCT